MSSQDGWEGVTKDQNLDYIIFEWSLKEIVKMFKASFAKLLLTGGKKLAGI